MPNLLGSVLFSFGILPPFRILMVRAWDASGSVPLAMVMHASLTASSIIFGPVSAPGIMGAAYVLSMTAALWIVVGVTGLMGGSHTWAPAPHAN